MKTFEVGKVYQYANWNVPNSQSRRAILMLCHIPNYKDGQPIFLGEENYIQKREAGIKETPKHEGFYEYTPDERGDYRELSREEAERFFPDQTHLFSEDY